MEAKIHEHQYRKLQKEFKRTDEDKNVSLNKK